MDTWRTRTVFPEIVALSRSNFPTNTGMSTSSWYDAARYACAPVDDRLVATRKSFSVLIATVAGNSGERPSGYRKTFVPLNSTKSGRDHDMALSSVSAA